VPFSIAASVFGGIPGAVQLSVTGDASTQSTIERMDAARVGQPVRNFDNTNSGLEQVIDCEAPLGRQVYYNLLAFDRSILAQTPMITCPPLASGKSIIRSVLAPQVAWLEVEPQDETGVQWDTSTTSYSVVGSDTPVVVGEVRQRHSGTVSFLCKSIPEANELVQLTRDGVPLLLRHSPCAGDQTRDILFYALGVSEVRHGRAGWRRVLVDYQSTYFVAGDTVEPPGTWTFAALRDSAANFAALAGKFSNFADMAMNRPKP